MPITSTVETVFSSPPRRRGGMTRSAFAARFTEVAVSPAKLCGGELEDGATSAHAAMAAKPPKRLEVIWNMEPSRLMPDGYRPLSLRSRFPVNQRAAPRSSSIAPSGWRELRRPKPDRSAQIGGGMRQTVGGGKIQDAFIF